MITVSSDAGHGVAGSGVYYAAFRLLWPNLSLLGLCSSILEEECLFCRIVCWKHGSCFNWSEIYSLVENKTTTMKDFAFILLNSVGIIKYFRDIWNWNECIFQNKMDIQGIHYRLNGLKVMYLDLKLTRARVVTLVLIANLIELRITMEIKLWVCQ